MEIKRYADNCVKMYTIGIETDYRGVSTIYDDRYKTLIYYYILKHKLLVVIDGWKAETELPNVVEKVRVVAKYQGREVNLLQKYLRPMIDNKAICSLPDDFFLDLMIELKSKKPLYSDVVLLYQKHMGILGW